MTTFVHHSVPSVGVLNHTNGQNDLLKVKFSDQGGEDFNPHNLPPYSANEFDVLKYPWLIRQNWWAFLTMLRYKYHQGPQTTRWWLNQDINFSVCMFCHLLL